MARTLVELVQQGNAAQAKRRWSQFRGLFSSAERFSIERTFHRASARVVDSASTPRDEADWLESNWRRHVGQVVLLKGSFLVASGPALHAAQAIAGEQAADCLAVRILPNGDLALP